MVAVASQDELVTTSTDVGVELSAPVELLFSLYHCGKFHDKHPAATPFIVRRDPRLADEALAFWTDAPGDFTELIVLARESGTLFDVDASGFIESLERTAASDFAIPDFPGELPQDAAAIRNHLLALRADAGLRARYVDLLRRSWAAIEEPVRERLSAGRRAAAELRRELAGKYWREAIPSWAVAWCTVAEPLLDPAAEAGELVVVPMFLNESGKFIFALPGLTLLAFVPGAPPADNRASREVAEAIAARHKVVSDPTRVQILGSLVKYPLSVSELATLYGLSQPTVSVHMKQLRDAALVTSQRDGAVVRYRADAVQLRSLVGPEFDALVPA